MIRGVDVRLGPRSYRVHIGGGALESLATVARQCGGGGRCAIITDSNVQPLYAARVEDSLREFKPVTIAVPAGEKSKALETVGSVCERMIGERLDRSSFVVALGGGVVGDLAGFVAAIYLRGIRFLQVPTTIIAQVDSAVGGKTGVNARGGKNLLGAFHQPVAVVADIETLQTLPEREFNEGFAEVIKHAVIADAAMLDELRDLDRADLGPLIARNVQIKADIVAADEHETSGRRALLNFGHTIGHAIENAAGYGRYLHGEAIALGIIAAARLSIEHAGLSQADFGHIQDALGRFNLPTQLPPEIDTEAVMAALDVDKKFTAGRVRFVLTPALGSAFVADDITRKQIRAAVEKLR